MAIIIHHGANGSYKSSGVVQDYLIPAIREGRVVVTNLEGCNLEKIYEVMGDEVHKDFDLIHVDAESVEGRRKLLTWWHWVPLGSLLIFDEAGKIFPKSLRPNKLEELNYKTLAEATEDGRPFKWLEAFQEHRKYNWDMILSAPNIKSIRPDIRETTEGAYKHSNLGKLGWLFKGIYKEGYHDADTSGAPSTIPVTETKRIKDKRVYALYKSTKTGLHKDTIAGKNLFKSIPLLGGLAICITAFVYAFSSGGLGFLFPSDPAPAEVARAAPVAVQSRYQNPDAPVLGPRGDVRLEAVGVDYPLSRFDGRIVGESKIFGVQIHRFEFTSPGFHPLQVSSTDLIEMGATVRVLSRCHATINFGEDARHVFCSPKLVPLEGGSAAPGV